MKRTHQIMLAMILGMVGLLAVLLVYGQLKKDICNMKSYLAQVNPLIQEWDGVFAIAVQTPRMSLPGVISDMQAIRRTTGEVRAPICFVAEHRLLLKSQDYYIEGFLAFLGKEDDSVVAGKFTRAARNLEWWIEAVKEKQ